MNRLEFMKELARLLADLPKEEKIEVLKYYNGYFDDAGEENETAIIEELGSPAKVAASVKAGMEDDLAEHLEFTEKGVDDEKTVQEYEESHSQGQPAGEGAGGRSGYDPGRSSADPLRGYGAYDYNKTDYGRDPRFNSPYEEPREGNNGWKNFAIVLLVIVTFPVWIGLAGGMLGLVVGLFGVLMGICGAAIGCMAGVLGAGIGCFLHGIAQLFVAPLAGMLSISVGLLLAGIGLILLLLCGWVLRTVFGRVLPFVFHMIGSVFSWIGGLFGRKRA